MRTPSLVVAYGIGKEAAAQLGDGPAVVMLFPYHVNHLALNCRVPIHRGAIEFLARYVTVVNLDSAARECPSAASPNGL